MGEKVFDIFYIYDTIQKKLIQKNLWNEYSQITFLKIMDTLPALFNNMKETITDEKIIVNESSIENLILKFPIKI
mgnify:CR=1 FL=1